MASRFSIVVFSSFVCLLVVSVRSTSVVELNLDNFDAKTSSGLWFVEFFAPWCGHCKKFAPIYEDAAGELVGQVHFGAVDATKEGNRALARRFSVGGFPTVFFFSGDGKMREYDSGRSKEQLIQYSKYEGYKASSQEVKIIPRGSSGSKPASSGGEASESGSGSSSDVVVLTDSNFDELVSSGGTWMVEFYAPWCGHCKRLAPTWEAFASATKGKLHVAKVDCTVHKTLSSRFGIRGFPSIRLITDGKVYSYSGQRDENSFTKFALEGGHASQDSTPLPPPVAVKKADPSSANAGPSSVVVLTEDNFDARISRSSKPWFVEFYAPWCGHCKKLAPTWDDLSISLKGKVNVAKVDAEENRELAGRFNVRGYPTIFYIIDGVSYEYEGDRTVDAFVAYTNQVFSKADGTAMPSGPGLLESTLLAYSKLFEPYVLPYEDMLNNNIASIFLGLTVVALSVGFVLGRLSAYVGYELERSRRIRAYQEQMKNQQTSDESGGADDEDGAAAAGAKKRRRRKKAGQ